MALHVTVYHGPIDSFNTLAHKPKKLSGFKERLLRMGYRIDLHPVDTINYCSIEMCGLEVFRCNLKNFLYDMPWHLDPVCQRAVQAVLDWTLKFRHARLYNWLSGLLDEQLFSRSEYAAKTYWPITPGEMDSSYTDCTDCAQCCGILFTKK